MRFGGYNDIPERVDEEELEELGRLQELLVGKSVTKVDKDRLRLSDGTVLRLGGNDGCGGCESGNYALTELNGCDNVVTNVSVERRLRDDNPHGYSQTYHLHVYAEHRRINLATFEGTDGNGYYGTGFWVEIERPEGAA